MATLLSICQTALRETGQVNVPSSIVAAFAGSEKNASRKPLSFATLDMCVGVPPSFVFRMSEGSTTSA